MPIDGPSGAAGGDEREPIGRECDLCDEGRPAVDCGFIVISGRIVGASMDLCEECLRLIEPQRPGRESDE